MSLLAVSLKLSSDETTIEKEDNDVNRAYCHFSSHVTSHKEILKFAECASPLCLPSFYIFFCLQGCDPFAQTQRSKLQHRRARINQQINKEMRMRAGAENLFR